MAACTLRGCITADETASRNSPTPADASNLRVVTEDEFHAPEFSCKPGEYFKVDCNMCKCGDGKNARCSKKRCVDGE